MDSVARFASPEALEAEVKRRGFHMVMMGDHYVILCRRDGPMDRTSALTAANLASSNVNPFASHPGTSGNTTRHSPSSVSTKIAM
jgi:hypothetical protein